MLCNDTGCHEAIRFEHLDVQTAENVNSILDMFKRFFQGNGRLTLIVSGGKVSDFETNTKTANKRKSA